MQARTVLGIAGAALALVVPASQAAAGVKHQATSPQIRAIMLRSQALNRKYHLGAYAPKPSKAQNRAIMLRSRALDRKYHLGAYAS